MHGLRLSRPAPAKTALICFLVVFASVGMLFQAGRASAHGYVDGPASRSALCKSGVNQNCGSIIYEPQSLEAPKGFPAAGPADGQIASAGGKFPELDQQSASRWSKVNMSSGTNAFTWTFTANHSTTGWKYYITKQNWDPNSPLSRASFDLTPFCSINYNGAQPTTGHTDTCNVPARSGYQVILAVWEIADTANAFYNVIDANFSGTNPTDATAPTAPASLTASTVAATSASLTWGAATDNIGVTGYNVYNGSKLVATVTGTSYTVTGLTASAAYTFTVKAIDAAGNESGASNSLKFTTTAPPVVDTAAPTAPGGLHIMGAPTDSSLMLMWTASTDNVGVKDYQIYNGSTLVTTASAAATSYTVTGLAASKTYSFTVYAIDAAGNKSAGSTISGTTAAAPAATDTTAPTAPGGLHIMGTPTDSSMMLMWTASTDNVGVKGYQIYNGSTLVTTASAAATSYTVTGLAASKTYSFTVYAIDAAGNKSAGSTISGTTSAASAIAAWATNTYYARGTFVTYNGHTYKCLQAHTSIYTWTPTAAVSLWELQK